MGMTINVEIADTGATDDVFDKVFDYFHYIDQKFSTRKDTSEITQINRGLIQPIAYSEDMKTVLKSCEAIKNRTSGYFDIKARDGSIDPSGLVKGWAIHNAAQIISQAGGKNFYVDAGGDIQAYGRNADNLPWRVGIRNPFEPKQIIKVVNISDQGLATSGTYVRGQHIYNPFNKNELLTDIVSLTVIAKDVYEADCLATAAFAMGRTGINFIESLAGFEGYQIDDHGQALMTSGFEKYITKII